MVEEIKKTKRRKVLVTGSSGMLGADLCNELFCDYDVVGLDIRKTPDFRSQILDFIKCDIQNKKRTASSIIDAKPDLIIHAAAWTDVDGCEKEPEKAKEINEIGTGNVAFSASALGIPVIYISTDFVFDGTKTTPYAEEDPPRPLNAYGKSKLGGERKVALLDKYVILRTSWLYGANGKNFPDIIIDKAKKEKELRIVDDQVGIPTYSNDFAKAISDLLSMAPMREIYHISNEGAVSRFDYAKEIIKIAGINNVKLLPIKSRELASPAKRPAFSVLDNSKFENVTGFAMRLWQEELAEYINEKK